MRGAHAAGAFQLVVEREAERAAATLHGEAMRRAGGDDEEIAAARRVPAPADRLWSLNAVRVPDGVAEAAVRAHLLNDHGIEIGAGLGPLAGKVWRVGLMGGGATIDNVERVQHALDTALRLRA